ncbi:MAG TPA: XdhC family protein, partial [Gaiellaceae bacterium]|nr:XdhC family protein [Gaiellaceae bacterium]
MTDIVATVVATRRSAPRPVGSKLVVREDGSLEGSVSGGCVESDVVVAAQEVRESGVPRLVTYGITDDMALGIGLPCGGEIDVFVEPFRELPDKGVVLTVVAGEGVGETLENEAL